jgi:hypothetical protein
MTDAKSPHQSGGASAVNQLMQGLARPFVALMQRWMPDAFIFAAVLSILTS